jgi:predicted dinucleotide-utilizing enzyme
MVLFEDTARDACAAFPANVNVAATLSLAGVGPESTQSADRRRSSKPAECPPA